MKKKSENNIQQQIVIWYTNNYCLKTQNPQGLIFSVPNGGNRNMLEAMTLKATGLLAGVSDLIVILPIGKILFVELKTPTGIQSDAQKDFMRRIENLGYIYKIIRTLDEFKTFIQCENIS